MRRQLERLIRWSRDVRWPEVSVFVAAIVLMIPEIVLIIEGELREVADLRTGWPAIVMAVLAYVIRSNVWSRAEVAQVAGDDLPTSVDDHDHLVVDATTNVPGV